MANSKKLPTDHRPAPLQEDQHMALGRGSEPEPNDFLSSSLKRKESSEPKKRTLGSGVLLAVIVVVALASGLLWKLWQLGPRELWERLSLSQ